MKTAEEPLGFSKRHAALRRLLEPGEVRRLSRLDPARPIAAAAVQWAKILLAWSLVALYPNGWLVALAIPLIGTSRYALQVLAHDGIHRRIFLDARLNDLFTDIVLLGSVGAVARLNGVNHLLHHKRLGEPDDPDRFKYSSENKRTRRALLLYLSGLSTVLPSVRNVFLIRQPSMKPERGTPWSERDLAIIGVSQAGLIGGLSWAIGWWAYPILWFLPFYVFSYGADMTRQFLEHAHPEPDSIADRHRLITHEGSFIERQFLSPLNMNLHAAHHLWPSIPYYNLPEADRLLRQRGDSEELVWRDSYMVALVDYYRALPLSAGAVGSRNG